MENTSQPSPDLNPYCPKCHQKQSLIHKYQSLITLLKKKADRTQSSHLSQSQKFSLGDLTTSHASFNGLNTVNRYVLPMVLGKLQLKMKSWGFGQVKAESYIKKSRKSKQFLNKLQKVCTFKQKHCFDQLKLLTKISPHQNILCSQTLIDTHQFTQQDLTNFKGTKREEKEKSENEMSIPLLNKKSETNQFQKSITVDQWNYKSLICAHEDLATSLNNSSPRPFRDESLPLLLSKNETLTSKQIKNLYKNLFVLEQSNYAYQLKIKNLECHMEEALSRQIKQNRKKTESLEMVAEEMAQKNQLILQLQQKITMLEEKYQCETNGVLEDELTQHRKQVEKLQKVNIKLDNELRKLKDKLTETESFLLQLQNTNSLTLQENTRLKQSLFDLEQKHLSYQSKQNNFKISCRKIQKILSQLKLQQKKYKFSNTTYDEEKFSLQQLYRLQLIFIFLYNIEDDSYNFSEHLHLFDEQQIEVLNQLKKKFNDLKSNLEKKDDLMESIQYPQNAFKLTSQKDFQTKLKGSKQHNNIQNIYCNQNIVDGSIFDVLNDHNDNCSRNQPAPKHLQRIEPEKNLTMKLLQMQIDKNKQIEKISELKQKNMYIRNIILNLMKSLQLKQSLLKTQTSGILDLIFDVFEYSEEQKQIIFTQTQPVKEKRFFGLI